VAAIASLGSKKDNGFDAMRLETLFTVIDFFFSLEDNIITYSASFIDL
jgi:hypothetical protein